MLGRIVFFAAAAVAVAGLAQMSLGAEAGAPQTLARYDIVAEGGAVIGSVTEDVAPTVHGRRMTETRRVILREEAPPLAVDFIDQLTPREISTRMVRDQDANGSTTAVSAAARSRDSWWRNEARIADGRAEITHATPAETRAVMLALPPGVRFDNGDGLLVGWDPVTTPRLEFANFDIEDMVVERVVVEAAAPRDASGTVAAWRKRYDGDALMSVAKLMIARDGHIVESTQRSFATSLSLRASMPGKPQQSASPYRPLPNAMIKSPFRISDQAMQGHIRYRFIFRDGIRFALPQTQEQSVHTEGDSVTLDICAACGPGMDSGEAVRAEALKPTPWLQSDARAIRAIAGPVAARHITDAEKMALLAWRVRSIMGRVVFVGHYSALETLSRKSGDCTEAATLLAALGRAAGIPTRVADGLVYSRQQYHGVANVFMPHSWTLAFVDGAWRSFDAALDTFDATHIALIVGDGDARELSASAQRAGLLQWDNMAEVRTPPSN